MPGESAVRAEDRVPDLQPGVPAVAQPQCDGSAGQRYHATCQGAVEERPAGAQLRVDMTLLGSGLRFSVWLRETRESYRSPVVFRGGGYVQIN